MACSTSSPDGRTDDRHRRPLRRQPGLLPQTSRPFQDELSVRASLHRTEVSQLERGLRLCRIDTLVKLAGSLEVPADDLLVGLTWLLGDVRIGRFVDRRDGGGQTAAR